MRETGHSTSTPNVTQKILPCAVYSSLWKDQAEGRGAFFKTNIFLNENTCALSNECQNTAVKRLIPAHVLLSWISFKKMPYFNVVADI